MTEEEFTALRAHIQSRMGHKRFSHTLRVEAEVTALANLFQLPQKQLQDLRIAALLHDITKECSLEQQLALCDRYGLSDLSQARLCPKLFHAKTGAHLAKELFPDLVTEQIQTAIERHTVGSPDYTLFDALLFLADYIEAGRTFADCVRLRSFFYDRLQKEDGNHPCLQTLHLHLENTLLLALDMTISDLLKEGAIIDSNTFAMRNAILEKQAKRKQSEERKVDFS